MRNRRNAFIALTVLVLFLAGCKIWLPWTKRVDMTRASADGLYQQGVEQYQSGNYKRAVDLFQRLKEEYPLSELAIMGEMGIADSYFSGKEYAEAELAYREFLNLHPTNENLPYVLYQIGMCHYNQITTIDRDHTEAFKALKEFERLVARFPASRFALLGERMIRECKRTLGEQEFYVGQFYFNIKQYRAALQRFEKVARDYPNVGLDFKVSHFLDETKRRLAETEQKKK